MDHAEKCMLCDAIAEIEPSRGSGGIRFVVHCSKYCPTFEITTRAIKDINAHPARKSAIIHKLKAFIKENPDDMPVIRMNSALLTAEVTTRSRANISGK